MPLPKPLASRCATLLTTCMYHPDLRPRAWDVGLTQLPQALRPYERLALITAVFTALPPVPATPLPQWGLPLGKQPPAMTCTGFFLLMHCAVLLAAVCSVSAEASSDTDVAYCFGLVKRTCHGSLIPQSSSMQGINQEARVKSQHCAHKNSQPRMAG